MGAVERFSARLERGEDVSPVLLSAIAAAERFSGAAGLGTANAARLAVIVEELVSNVLRHGACDAPLSLTLVLTMTGGEVCIALEDDGIAFDPTAARGFDGPDPESGGSVGLAMVRAWTRAMDYDRRDGTNRLSLVLPATG